MTHAASSLLDDYQKVQDLLSVMTEKWRDQPSLDVLSQRIKMSPDGVQRLFQRWAGISPKAFLQALTLDHAKAMLLSSENLLETSLATSLSGPGRLHDLFVIHERMTPGQWRRRGEGLTICYGFHPSPFGVAVVMATGSGLCGIGFVQADGEAAALADMTRRWPKATFQENSALTAPFAAKVFASERWQENERLRITLIGTDFEIRVWEALLRIPVGRTTTYGDIATLIGQPKAARAVGAAVGRNPISFVVPCHRVLSTSGDLTGYHWGLTRKRAMLGWEAGYLEKAI